MKIKLSFLLSCVIFIANAQSDRIFKHNGEVVDGNVVRVAEYTVVFKYLNEDAEQTISKYAVGQIEYGKSKRKEQITDKIIVNSEADWDNVVILEDKSQISGLKKVDEIRGKTSFINYHTAATGDKKASMKLKKAAAEMGCQFIYMTADKETNYTGAQGKQFGGTQAVKKGVAYKY